MRKVIVKLLLKYDILKIIPMRESFFKISVLAKKIKLSPELIRLNYEKLSPIKNPTILHYRQDDVLYLWFLKKQPSTKEILLPESFLIFKGLQNKQDGIFIFETVPNQIYVIKQKKLQAAFTSSQSIDSANINIIKDEYNLADIQIFDKKEHDKILHNELQSITLQELFAFIQFQMDKESLKKIFVQKLTYPLVSLLLIYMLVSYAQGYFMQKKVDILTQKYQTLKAKNTKVKSAIQKHNQGVQKLERFFKTEFEPIEPFKITGDLYKIITPKDKATVIYLSVANGNVNIRIKTRDNALKYLNRFNAVAYLNNVIIENTLQLQNGYNIFTYSMTIKANNGQ